MVLKKKVQSREANQAIMFSYLGEWDTINANRGITLARGNNTSSYTHLWNSYITHYLIQKI